MAHLYLHIGTPKAGSSSIQNFLLQEGPGSPFEYIDSCGGLCGHKFLSVPSFRGQVAPEIEARIPRKYRLSGLQDIAWDQIEAEILPEGKLDAVRALRERFGPVIFVGDGINDAPALAEADVGLAIGTGTDVAIESADVVLSSGAVAGAVNALHVSRAVMRNIRQNLVWAFGYNVALIPVAAGLLYPLTGMMLSPMLISLPFKIMLFVLVDGWTLVLGTLAGSFAT